MYVSDSLSCRQSRVMSDKYNELKSQGYTIFVPLAAHCVEFLSAVDTSYVVVLSSDSSRTDRAIVLVTAATNDDKAREIQNIVVRLNEVHGFVSTKIEIADQKSVREFLRDADAVKHESRKPAEKHTIESYSPTLQRFASIISEAVRERASDIHYSVNETSASYVFRIDGLLQYERGMNVGEAREMLSSALQSCGRGFTGLEDDKKKIDVPIVINVEIDDAGVLKHEKVTLRLSRRGTDGGYKATFRVIRTRRQHQSLQSLGFKKSQEDRLQDILDAPYGIFLATGPVGSGKSTANVALIESVDENRGGITIEDPIEYHINHRHIQQFQVDNPDELQTLLKASLRHDPDIVGVSEIRDSSVAELVFSYSRVGTVMISTIHTNEAIGTFARLIDLGIPKSELASPDTFLGILNQRLMGVLCESCKIERHIEGIGVVYTHDIEGCQSCKNGRKPGRVAVAELLIPEHDDSPFIHKEDWYGWREHLIQKGFVTIALRALELSQQGIISWSDARKMIPHMKDIKRQLDLHQNAVQQINFEQRKINSTQIIKEVANAK